jgi:hypothetical protein
VLYIRTGRENRRAAREPGAAAFAFRSHGIPNVAQLILGASPLYEAREVYDALRLPAQYGTNSPLARPPYLYSLGIWDCL